MFQAEQAVEAAKANHAAAVARLEDLLEADEDEIESAQASLESAQASLASAQAQYDELVAGPTENAIAQQQQDVRLAELSAEEAQAALADLTVFAPFDGVVEAINVQPGDRVSAGIAAFTLNTSDRMLIALTVTEEELLELEVGQTGVAFFDAIEGVQYPVQVESVSRVPNAEQGVVTYDVEARILGGANLAEAANQTPPAGFRPGGGAFGGGAAGGEAVFRYRIAGGSYNTTGAAGAAQWRAVARGPDAARGTAGNSTVLAVWRRRPAGQGRAGRRWRATKRRWAGGYHSPASGACSRNERQRHHPDGSP